VRTLRTDQPCYDATVPQTLPYTDSLHHRLGAFKHLNQFVLCHHDLHRKAIIEPSLRPQRRLHQESRCQTLCTLSCDAHPVFSSHPDPSSAYGTREQRTKKGIYRPLGPGLGTFEPVKRYNTRQESDPDLSKIGACECFLSLPDLKFFIQALILFILSDIMIRDHPYIGFSWACIASVSPSHGPLVLGSLRHPRV
jgi:hypothetical protein